MDEITVSELSLDERIYRIIAEESERPRETLDRNSVLGADLFDSLGLVELIMALEEEFEISIPDDEAEKIKTVGELIDAIQARFNSSGEDKPDATAAPPGP